MKVVETKNLEVGKTYLTTINHISPVSIFHWKKNGKLIHPSDPNHVWVNMTSPGNLKPKESFELIEQTNLGNQINPGKWLKVVTSGGVTGWMWIDEYATLYKVNETLELGKLYNATYKTTYKDLPRDCPMMEQVVRVKPTNNAQRITVKCWHDCFVLLGYNNDGRWMNVLTGTGNIGWVRNNVELEIAERS